MITIEHDLKQHFTLVREGMLLVRIINMRNMPLLTLTPSYYHTVDRSTALGNPFYMRAESERNHVCEQYAEWLQQHATDERVAKQLLIIERGLRTHMVANLACWCAPLRCHAQEIAKLILHRTRDLT